jgi:hypothetical protein
VDSPGTLVLVALVVQVGTRAQADSVANLDLVEQADGLAQQEHSVVQRLIIHLTPLQQILIRVLEN